MKPEIRRKASFLCKSMLWSALLYMAFMLIINWDEVNRPNPVNAGSLTETKQKPTDYSTPADPAIADKHTDKVSGIIGNVFILIRNIAGFSLSAL